MGRVSSGQTVEAAAAPAVAAQVLTPAAAGEQTEAVRPLRADAHRNRTRLVETAREVLAARGSAATVDEIARTAGVGVGTLYRHFPRRIDLVEAVYREDVDELVELAARLAATTAPWEGLGLWLEGFVRYAEAKRTMLTELHEAFEKSPDLAVELRDRIRDAAAAVLSRAQEAGMARGDLDGADLMQLVGGMCMARGGGLAQNRRLLGFVLDGIRAPATCP